MSLQKFIFRRGLSRWLMHQLIMWGCIISALITFPLVFGWVHFELEGDRGYRAYVFGFPLNVMDGRAAIAWVTSAFGAQAALSRLPQSVNACPFGVPKYNTEMHLQMKCDMCFDRSSEGLKPMCASVCPTGAISFGKYEDIVPLRRTKPVNAHVFGNQKVETKVYLMLPTEADEVEVDGCGVFEGRLKTDRRFRWKSGA